MLPRARPLRVALSLALTIALLILLRRRMGESRPKVPNLASQAPAQEQQHQHQQQENSISSPKLPAAPQSSLPPSGTNNGLPPPGEAQLEQLAAEMQAANKLADAARRKALREAKARAAALSKRVIVASLQTEDTSWTATELPPGWEAWVYVVDEDPASPSALPLEPPLQAAATTAAAGAAASKPPVRLRTPGNKGHEAGVFLWYLYSQYDSLAATNVFLHAHRDGYPQAWHVDNEAHSNPLSVRRLRLETVQEKGFVNLRCLPNPGCPEDVQPFRDMSNETEEQLPHERAIRESFVELFNLNSSSDSSSSVSSTISQDTKGYDSKDKSSKDKNSHLIPHTIAAPCCSQFAVSAEQVRKRPRADYERFYRFIKDTTLTDAVSGRVFEYLWHLIFGRDAVFCPEPYECYCDVYGDGCLAGVLDLGLDVVEKE